MKYIVMAMRIGKDEDAVVIRSGNVKTERDDRGIGINMLLLQRSAILNDDRRK